ALSSVACALAAKGFQTPQFDWAQDLTIAGGTALLFGLCASGHFLQRGMAKWRVLVISSVTALGAGFLVGAIWGMLAGRDIAPMASWLAIVIGVAVGGIVG